MYFVPQDVLVKVRAIVVADMNHKIQNKNIPKFFSLLGKGSFIMDRYGWLKFCIVCLSLVSLSVVNCAMAYADAPWKWEFDLKRDKVMDSIVLPTSLFIDPKKELYYVVDSGKDRLLSFDKEGELVNIFTAGNSLKDPFDMARTEDGVIWVVEKGRNSLTRINLSSREAIPETIRYKGRLVYPDRLESSGNMLYLLDKASGSILSLTTDLVPQHTFSCSDCPGGFVDFKLHDQGLYALDQTGKIINIFDLSGTLTRSIELGDTVIFPVSIAVGPSGFIYVLDRHARNIVVYDGTGVFKYRFLNHGFSRSGLYYPNEIRFDVWDRLCVTDEGNARVMIFVR